MAGTGSAPSGISGTVVPSTGPASISAGRPKGASTLATILIGLFAACVPWLQSMAARIGCRLLAKASAVAVLWW
ncbi:MAG: hypothetical protein ACK6C0_01360 [Betaproteobacteria bacterium]